MTERAMKAVIAERCLVLPGCVQRVRSDCPIPLGPPWRLSMGPASDLVVSGLFVGMRDLLDDRRQFCVSEPCVEQALGQTGAPANSFCGGGFGLPLHGPHLQQGSLVAVDLFNPCAVSFRVWVSLWGTLP